MNEAGKKYYYSSVIGGVLILLCGVPIAFGIGPASGVGDQRVLTTAQQQLQERVTFTCRNLPIDTVLMQLAEQAKVDIIKSPKVKGDVTVKVTDVPLDEALNNILAAHGWTYVASENMIRVMPLAEVDTAKEKLATSIYQITYANVDDVASALKSYVSDKGKIASNKGTNHIIVTDTDGKIKAIDRFIAQIDRETPQVMVEARIYDITTTEGFEIGVEWSAGRNTPLTSLEQKRTSSRTDEAVPPYSETTDITAKSDITDTTNIVETFYYLFDEATGKRLPTGEADDPDTPWDDRYQVDSESTKFGKESESKEDTKIEQETKGSWVPPSSWGTKETTEVTEEDMSWLVVDGIRQPVRRSKPFIGGTFTQDKGGTLKFGLLNDMIDLEIALSMLSSQVEAKLLANPRVLVLDNETANIKIVTEIPYSESLQTVGGAGGLMVARVQFKDVGVQLFVTPHVAREGMIRLKLKPEFGVQAQPGEITTGAALQAPAVNTRTLETIALVKDGQTVVMGGLRKKEVSKDIKKVPLLGDMPLLGNLFRYETEQEKTNELVVFITPKIVSTNVLTEVEEKQLEATRISSPGLSKAGTKKRGGAGSAETDVVAAQSEEDMNKG